jgi:hypothetical protein
MPALAVCLVLKSYCFSLFMNLAEFYMGLMANDLSARQVNLQIKKNHHYSNNIISFFK